MAVRFRKYFPQCKLIPCSGRPGKSYCPGDRPKRSNGEYKDCGVWCIEFFDDSKVWQSLTFKDIRNKTEAERRLAMFIGDRERGQLNLPKKRAIPTLAEYSISYLELRKNEKENTRCARKFSVNNLLRYLGNYRLDKITAFIVERFRVERKEKDQVKDGTINDDVKFLSHIFTIAIQEDIVDANPCKEIKRLKVSQARDRILTSGEIKLMLELPQSKDRMMILTSLFTGMRLNEVLSLKWTDIELAKGLITFIQSKTGKLITIPLSSYLKGQLQSYRGDNSGDKVFETRDITRDTAKRYSMHFSRLFKGLGIHGFTFHNLRHTFSSLQAELGTGAVITKDILGHSTLDMTLRYSHTGLDSKKKAIQALTDHVLAVGNNAGLAIAQ